MQQFILFFLTFLPFGDIIIGSAETEPAEQEEISYTFRDQELYDSHFEKHGAESGCITKEEYLQKDCLILAVAEDDPAKQNEMLDQIFDEIKRAVVPIIPNRCVTRHDSVRK